MVKGKLITNGSRYSVGFEPTAQHYTCLIPGLLPNQGTRLRNHLPPILVQCTIIPVHLHQKGSILAQKVKGHLHTGFDQT